VALGVPAPQQTATGWHGHRHGHTHSHMAGSGSGTMDANIMGMFPIGSALGARQDDEHQDDAYYVNTDRMSSIPTPDFVSLYRAAVVGDEEEYSLVELRNQADVMMLHIKALLHPDHVSVENMNVAMKGLLLLSYCSEDIRIVTINMLRMAMCQADIQYTLPPSLFALARDLSIIIRGIPNLSHANVFALVKTLEAVATRLVLLRHMGVLQHFDPAQLAAFVDEFSTLALVANAHKDFEVALSLRVAIEMVKLLPGGNGPPPSVARFLKLRSQQRSKQPAQGIQKAINEIFTACGSNLAEASMCIRLVSHLAAQDYAVLKGMAKYAVGNLTSGRWTWELGVCYCQLLVAVALDGATSAMRKSAILSSDWQGGLADMCKLGNDTHVPGEAGQRQNGPWCVRRHALECLLVLQRHCDDEGFRTLAGRIFLSLTSDEDSDCGAAADTMTSAVTAEGSLGDVTEACKLSSVLLHGLRKQETQAKTEAKEALLLPMKANIVRLAAQAASTNASSKTPPADPTPKVVKVKSPRKRPDCVVASTSELRSILLAQVHEEKRKEEEQKTEDAQEALDAQDDDNY